MLKANLAACFVTSLCTRHSTTCASLFHRIIAFKLAIVNYDM
jgi:hypothetical protein